MKNISKRKKKNLVEGWKEWDKWEGLERERKSRIEEENMCKKGKEESGREEERDGIEKENGLVKVREK